MRYILLLLLLPFYSHAQEKRDTIPVTIFYADTARRAVVTGKQVAMDGPTKYDTVYIDPDYWLKWMKGYVINDWDFLDANKKPLSKKIIVLSFKPEVPYNTK